MLGTENKLDTEEIIKEFEALSKDAERVQRETLRRILEDNGNTEYLQKWGLNGRTDPEAFKACIPVVTHLDLEPFIQRIVDGDRSPVLTGKPVTTMSLSSGTTNGKPKFVPFNDQLMDTTMQIYKTSFAFRNREFPIENGKALQFIYASKHMLSTKGGLAVGIATTNVFRNSLYKTTMRAMQTPYCSPDEVIFSPDFHQSLYCHLLCGLLFRDEVQVVSSTFCHSIVNAFRTFEQVFEELCADIRYGTLSSRITDPSIRTAMSKLLKPDGELADIIYKKCRRLRDWHGLIPELFPNVRYVYGIMTGSMEPYLEKMRHYAREVPLVCADYGSCEGWIGAIVKPKLPPELATFAVLPQIGYYEFVPFRGYAEGMEPKALGLTEVKIGEEYEILITTFGGLYRYKLGDVIKVMGFYNSTPELKFVCRRSLLLNINIDKTTEKDLQLSVEAATKLLAKEKLEVIDFTSHADKSREPGHYVIFWEISGNASEEVLQECCDCLDLSFVNDGYVSSRKVKSIGSLELRIVKRGTFHKVLEHYMGLGSAPNQFKTPRCVAPTNESLLQIMCSSVVKSYFSCAYN